jgi:hypothetical protein
MQKTVLLILASFALSLSSYSQLTRGNWLDGGGGSFTASNTAYSSKTYNPATENIYLKISPNIGYFFMNKFASGLRLSFSWAREAGIPSTGANSISNVKKYEGGPFVRYYFLRQTKPCNILVDICYQYGIYAFKRTENSYSTGPINTFSVMAGPVVYLNQSVGIEFTVGYFSRNEDRGGSYKITQQGMQVGVGCQIHLHK